jgi:serine/threonine protein kinase
MKPKLKLQINTKELKPRISLDSHTPKHKHSTSSITSTTINKIPGTTRAKPTFSSFLSPNASKSSLKSKHVHSASQQFLMPQKFPISPQNSRLIKLPKSDLLEDISNWKVKIFPLSPEQVMVDFRSYLSSFEETEIESFPEVFYIGLGVNKSRPGGKNHGFDDDEGDYRVIIGDHLAYRYEILSMLGSGSFGKVLKVADHKENQEFAVKIIKNKPRFNEQAREEVQILEYLKNRNFDNSFNVIHLLDSFQFRGHTCLKFELLGMNLYQYLKVNNFQGCPSALLKRFSVQILQALRLMDRFKVIHCDLKPENILMQGPESLDVKVIDFGSAVFYEKRIYTYIQSRYYRAPEVILGLDYSTAIDMWSFGCILAELATGRPTFAGESEAEQIQCMMEVLGPPPLKVINKASRKNLYFEMDGKPKVIPNSKGRKRVCGSKKLRDVVKGADETLLDLISACFEWDQLKRISPDEALLHPWLNENLQTQFRFKHGKTQSEAVLKPGKLFTIRESYLA